LWDVTTGRQTVTLAEGSPVAGVAFSPDGNTLAVGDGAGRVRLWDMATGRRTATLNEGNPVLSVAFSPDGKTFVAGDSVGGVGVWNAANWQHIADLNESGAVSSLAFAPHDQVLAIASLNGNVVLLWQNLANLTPPLFTHLICDKVRVEITQAQWAKYAPGQPYQKTCPLWGSGVSVHGQATARRHQ
jgi:WD40 repeat protein